jgi:hypothetical protein
MPAMTITWHAREADRPADDEATTEPRPIDLSPLEYEWISVSGVAGGLQRFRLQADDGSAIVSATGHGEPTPGDWGAVRADGVFVGGLQSNTVVAFIATFEGPQVTSQLETYHALAQVTGHTFHRFTDGSGRRDYFTREFYVHTEGGQPAAAGTFPPEATGEFPAALRSGRNDPGQLLGTWRGTDPAIAKSISTLECDLVDGDFAVRAWGVGPDGPIDWGVVPAQLYADAAFPHYPPAFLATFDHGYMRVHVQARINRGLMVACEYTQFTDGSGRPDYWFREVYRT